MIGLSKVTYPVLLFRLVVGTVTVRGVVGPLGSPAELTKLRLILRKLNKMTW